MVICLNSTSNHLLGSSSSSSTGAGLAVGPVAMTVMATAAAAQLGAVVEPGRGMAMVAPALVTPQLLQLQLVVVVNVAGTREEVEESTGVVVVVAEVAPGEAAAAASQGPAGGLIPAAQQQAGRALEVVGVGVGGAMEEGGAVTPGRRHGVTHMHVTEGRQVSAM
jgi:hypothetical protein